MSINVNIIVAWFLFLGAGYHEIQGNYEKVTYIILGSIFFVLIDIHRKVKED